MRYIIFIFLVFIGCTSGNNFSPPNVILILTDDQGYGDIGAHGNPWIQTPHLDRLYSQSVRFTDFHVGTTCAPTRSGLLTGKNCNRVGVWHTINGRSLLPNEEVTLAEVFKNNGYRTAIFGKWHLGDNYPFRPQDQGFEEVLIHGGGGVGQTPDYWNNDYFDDTYFHNGQPRKFEGYCTDVWFDQAQQFIQENQEQPFFCYISTNAPHGPYHIMQEYIDLYKDHDSIPNPNFYGMITHLDQRIGDLEQQLERLGLKENTILVFATDNGTSSGADLDQQGYVKKGFNAGMRGKKGSEYEGGHRVPLFIRWPETGIDGGVDITTLTSYTDLMPTLMDLCQLNRNSTLDFDGQSLLPLIRGKTEQWPDRVIITDTQRKEFLEKGKNSAVMTQQWRLIKGMELYDMENDPGQTRNVAQQHPEVVESLNQAYQEWWEKISVSADQYIRIVVGDSAANPADLTVHDVHTEAGYPAWNQEMVRLGQGANGFWALRVKKPGTYKISLHRWPREAGVSLNQAVPPGQEVPGGTAYSAGKVLNISQGHISIQGLTLEKDIKENTAGLDFEIDLAAGDHQLKTWFVDGNGKEIPAFYVYVEKISDQSL
ncbi:MAG: arylsulfatase [Candidatus Cyclobacteriaceae bacterium M3_2C_046]